MKRAAQNKLDKSRLDKLWTRHDAQWRDPAQIISQWHGASEIDPRLLRYTVRGDWWEILATSRVTMLITREYEHLMIAMCADEAGPNVSYLPLPHPSGLAVDRKRNRIYVASTRNPNQILDLMPVTGLRERLDVKVEPLRDRPLVPVRSRYLPGSLYLHDLAMIGDRLHASAVGENAIVRLFDDGRFDRVWWPRSIETNNGPIFGQNHLQLNSIAAGTRLTTSYFSASTEKPLALRPGHQNFPVDKRGVIFSGATRDPVVRGLTRPHSARRHERQLWVNNSGYGELCLVRDGGFESIARLPGWTRGLCFHNSVAFVGTSRVIPRFRQYAPGLDVNKGLCGLHAVEIKSGKVLGSLNWPFGNQIFAVELVSSEITTGLPFLAGAKRALDRERKLFYSFQALS
jgi:uncharacterized protein (TIGR03032 family)